MKARDFKRTTLQDLLTPLPEFWEYLTAEQRHSLRVGRIHHLGLSYYTIPAPPLTFTIGDFWPGRKKAPPVNR